MQIYITRGADSSGPFSLEDVRAYYEQGMLLPDDLAYHEGLADWTPLEAVLAATAPAPVEAVPMPQPQPQREPAAAPVAMVEPVGSTPKSGRKTLVVAGAIAGLVVFGGVGTVVYLKFIKGDGSSPIAEEGTPKKKISAYVPTNAPPTNSLPPNPSTLIPGLPGVTPVTNVPPTVSDLPKSLPGKTLRLSFRAGGDSDVTFFPDGTGAAAKLPARIPHPFKWSLEERRVKLAFDDGSRTNYLAFKNEPLAMGNAVVLLTTAETQLADGDVGSVDGVEDAKPIAPVTPPPTTLKLSPDQVAALLTPLIGRWENNGTVTQEDAPPEPWSYRSEIVWKDEGKAIEIRIAPGEASAGGVHTREYDEIRGLFILKQKDDDSPEKEFHETFDPATRTLNGKIVSPAPPPGTRLVTEFKPVADGKYQWTVQGFAQGELIFTETSTLTRRPPEPKPVIGTPPIPPPIPLPTISTPPGTGAVKPVEPVEPEKPIEPETPNEPEKPAEPAPQPEIDSASAKILEAAVRRQLRKPEGELTADDFAKVKSIAVGGGPEKVSDLSYLVNCPNLENFFAQSQAITNLAPLAKLTKLKDISISFNPVKDLTPLAGLAELDELWLQGAQVEDVTPLAGLAKLETLYLDRNKGLTDLKPLAGLPALRHLSLYEMGAVNLAPLAGLPKIEKLNLAKLPPEALATLKPPPQLKDLVFSPNQDTDLAALLGKMKSLEKLRVTDARRVSLRALVDAVKGHESLFDLGLPMGGISDTAPLADLPNLTRLDLVGNHIENLQPLGGLEKLETLLLSGNRVKDVSPLAGCKKLSTLWLLGNQVKDPTPLHEMKQLRSITLRGNPATAEQLDALRAALPRCFVDNKRAPK